MRRITLDPQECDALTMMHKLAEFYGVSWDAERGILTLPIGVQLEYICEGLVICTVNAKRNGNQINLL